jgi:hypothetical protein
MDTITNLHRYLETWLKVSPLADVMHRILRYDGLLLVTYCGRSIPLQDASKQVLGARHCEVCESLHRRREQDRLKAIFQNERSEYAGSGK